MKTTDENRENLIYRLLETGLLQPGIFEDGSHWQLRLEMLPSYPDILLEIATHTIKIIAAMPIDRLVCTWEALPLGVLVSTQTGLPLIYSRGQGEAPTHDFVGAYDVGHPAGLLTYALQAPIEKIIQGGQSVGLQIGHIIAVVNHSKRDFSMLLASIFDEEAIEKAIQKYMNNSARFTVA